MRHALGVILLVIAGTSNAAPVVWILNDVTFDDNSRIYDGQFTYDADTGIYSNISITTEASPLGPAGIVGNVYSILGNLVNASSSTASRLDIANFVQYSIPGGSLLLVQNLILDFTAPLTNAGGTFSLAPASTETVLGPTQLIHPEFDSTRSVTQGTVSSVPVPPAVWLFGSGLGLLGFVRRKKPAT